MPDVARRAAVASLILTAWPVSGSSAITEAEIAACLNAPETQTDPALCATAAQKDCLAFPETAPSAAAECFLNAKAEWDGLIAGRMKAIAETAPERVAAIARIEVKYDLLANLLHCDRLEELARLGDTDDEHLLRQRTQCEATAAGLSYLKLLRRSEGLE